MSFIHITDPYADEPAVQSTQRQAPAPHPQYTQEQSNPQYVDVAASSLKAMIDPALEQTSGSSHQRDNEGAQLAQELEQAAHAPDGGGETTEHDNLQDTIMKALRQTNEQAQSF